MKHLQAILDKAGPSGPGSRRDAAEILTKVPWVKPPRQLLKMPRLVEPEVPQRRVPACPLMKVPKIEGIETAAWWRSLLAVALNTGMRRRTLLTLKWEWIDWKRCRATIPADAMKGRRPQVFPLNRFCVQHLLAIRGDREAVFPWPHHLTYFNTCFHRLLRYAGIPPEEHFGLHRIRKNTGSALWEKHPGAELILGHASIRVTQNYYVAQEGIMARALEQLFSLRHSPRPWQSRPWPWSRQPVERELDPSKEKEDDDRPQPRSEALQTPVRVLNRKASLWPSSATMQPPAG